MDCRLRAFIYQIASIIVFVLIIVNLLSAIMVPLEINIYKAFKELGRSTTLESDVKTTLWIIYFAIIAIVLFLIRLYFSMEIFDSHESYFHDYIEPLHPILRTLEWLIRLGIMVYLLFALAFGFNTVNDFLAKSIGLTFPEQKNGFISIRSFMFFLTIFFLFLIFWDIFLIAPQIRLKKFLRFFLRFFLPHLLGLFMWGALTYLFWSERTISRNPMPFAIFSTILIGFQIILVLWSLFIGRGKVHRFGLFGEGSLLREFCQHTWGKLRFILTSLKCSNPSHKKV